LSAATAAAAPATATATAMASFLRKKRNIRLVATASGNRSGASKIKGEQEEKGEDSNATTAARQDSNDWSSEVKANKMQKSIGSNRFNKNSKRLFPRPVVQ